MDHRPSVVAAAAILAAYDNHLPEGMLEMKISVVPSWGPSEKVINFSFLSDVVCLLSYFLRLILFSLTGAHIFLL